MNRSTLVTSLGCLAFAGVLGWWTWTVTRHAALTPAAPTALQSPFTLPVIDQLAARTIYGELPVPNPGLSERADPFVRP